MFAIVRTGGKQYRVAPGDKIVVERLDGNAGDKITLGDILLAGEGSDLKSVDGLKVQAEIIAQAKGEKVTVFKKRRRHNYRRKKGHRQLHTILQITAIGDQKMEKKPVPSKAEGAAAPKAEKTAAAPVAEAPEAQAPQAEAVTETAAPAPAKEAKKPAKKAETTPEAQTEAQGETQASTENAAPAKAAAKKPAAKAPAKKK